MNNITYDANGNILSLNRYKNTQSGSNRMDELTYHYKANKNQLDRVTDAYTGTTNAADIKTQNTGNYTYNKIGQLTHNAKENVAYVYNAAGLVTEVQKNNVPLVKFFYNDKGHRVRKEVYNTGGTITVTDYYIRDASGSVMAIYNNSTLTEQPIYGQNRLGVHYRVANKDRYQLTDHLGNVRAVIAKATTTPSTTRDYYPGGMPMPDRQTIGGELYRYGYQGEFAETDPETGKPAFELRLYDPRINRWLSPDPYRQYASPYLSMGNNWISRVDPDGGCDTPGSDCGFFKRLWFNITGRGSQVDIWKDWQQFEGIPLDEITLIATQNQPRHSDKMQDAVQRSFYKGYWLAKLWEKYGYFEVGVSTIKGAPLEAKLTKAWGIEVATNKQTIWSANYNNRDGGLVTKGIENHDKEFTIGAGAVAGGSFSIIDNPNGNVQVGGALAYQAVTVEYLGAVNADQHEKKHSVFIGLDISPALGIYYGVEGRLRLGFLIEK